MEKWENIIYNYSNDDCLCALGIGFSTRKKVNAIRHRILSHVLNPMPNGIDFFTCAKSYA